MSLTCLKLLKFKQWQLSNDEQDCAAVPACVWRLSLVIPLSQQTNMFEAQPATAKHAPQAISNVQKILIFQASKSKINKEKKGGKILWMSMSSGMALYLCRRTLRDHLGQMMS